MSIDVGLFNYWVVAILMVSGLYTVISRAPDQKDHRLEHLSGVGVHDVHHDG